MQATDNKSSWHLLNNSTKLFSFHLPQMLNLTYNVPTLSYERKSAIFVRSLQFDICNTVTGFQGESVHIA